MNRRGFIAKTAAAAAGAAVMPLLAGRSWAADVPPTIAIVLDPTDALAKEAPVKWAAEYLRDALNARGAASQIFESLEQVPTDQECVVATGADVGGDAGGGRDGPGRARGARFGAKRPGHTEIFAGVRVGHARTGLCIAGTGGPLIRARDPLATLRAGADGGTAGQPHSQRHAAVRQRCRGQGVVSRSRVLAGLPDDAGSPAVQPFPSRAGLGYDGFAGFATPIFIFAYPFLVNVPGYDMRVAGFRDDERNPNLECSNSSASEADLRGLHFQLGIWTHALQWANGPQRQLLIEGLRTTSRPPIRAMRLHRPGGVPGDQGRHLPHSRRERRAGGELRFLERPCLTAWCKPADEWNWTCTQKAWTSERSTSRLATGLPVSDLAEILGRTPGTAVHAGGIRSLEMPPRNARNDGFFSLSSGSRSFLRYSYGDLLAEDRKYAVLHRIWPGTQRMLLWGDAASAAALGRNWNFCGSDGMELMEPLSFKGRKGSGKAGGRDGYAEAALSTGGSGWDKYAYTYRLWGRLSYNPDAKPETWKRFLKKEFGAGAEPAEMALAGASRILPLIASAHAPSAGNNTYWPEMYLNMPIVNETRRGLYGDSPTPRRFGTVSPLDPQMFSTIDGFAAELLEGPRSGKYSPAEVAQWVEREAQNSSRHLAVAEKQARQGAEFRRLSVDVKIQNGTGMFFAGKLRAGILYALYQRSGHRPALERALAEYRQARAAWADFTERTKGVYVADVTYGLAPELRGNWVDRLGAMDADVADMQKKLDEPAGTETAIPRPWIGRWPRCCHRRRDWRAGWCMCRRGNSSAARRCRWR